MTTKGKSSHDQGLRFIEVLKHLAAKNSTSVSQIIESIGVTSGSVSNITSRGTGISVQAISKLISQHPEVNPTYILLGTGDMFGAANTPKPTTAKVLPVAITAENEERIVFVPQRAQAGFFNEYPEGQYARDLINFSLPQYNNGAAVAFEVSGMSMVNTLHPGDIVVAEPVEKLEWMNPKEIHVVAADRGLLIKRFIYHKDRQELEWIADNPDYNPEEREQRTIPAGEVRHVFKYYCHITRHAEMPDYTLKRILEILTSINSRMLASG